MKIKKDDIITLVVLFVVQSILVILKAVGVIEASWWIVLLPLIIPGSIIALALLVVFIMVFIW